MHTDRYIEGDSVFLKSEFVKYVSILTYGVFLSRLRLDRRIPLAEHELQNYWAVCVAGDAAHLWCLASMPQCQRGLWSEELSVPGVGLFMAVRVVVSQCASQIWLGTMFSIK